jgi:predicted Ser/Thr protein kinase
MQIDYPKLHERVRSLLKTKLDPAETPDRSPILKIIQIISGCKECLNIKLIDKAKLLGSGAFGWVFDIGKGLAMKVEIIRDAVAAVQGVPTAIKAGKAGIGPKVHSWKVCDCVHSLYLVTVMDKIIGKTLYDFLKKSKVADNSKVVTSVKTALETKLKKMAKLGIIHQDLHEGNIMVDTKNEPWIIDFTYDAFVGSNVEKALAMVDAYSRSQVNVVGAIFKALEKEGTIVVKGKTQIPKQFIKE